MKKSLASTVLSVVLVSVLSGCGGGANEAAAELHYPHLTESGDIQEMTAGAAVMPEFLKSQNKNVALIYKAVAQYSDLLDDIPCYCGCGESAGHRSSKDCFIKEVQEDGAIVWDDHGTKCNVCMEIAVESITLSRDGKSSKDIRTMIDAKYQEGYAEPTNTPAI
ncbi:hypothetical protein FHR92_002126 [Fontibacillus solani]|uniref:Lipoprotein n=1 Tax=Fontibacillus solani TaxID=1572857 RepID=A0A7W3ST71_9BACL|nr:PCYCGC domain-containing protein [Fontibacillus solani]MBA9085659.1 hypothetical protein [Fontibacillus solani]